MATYLAVGAGAVDGVLKHREGRQEFGVLPQDLQLHHLGILVLVRVPGVPTTYDVLSVGGGGSQQSR